MGMIPTEPLFVGERFIRVLFYIAPRNPGDPQTIVGTFTLMPGEDNIVLDAIKGDKGDKGDPAPFWRPEWNSTITRIVDLPPASGPNALKPSDAGRAWYIDGYWHIWTGTGYRTILGAIPGPPGPTPDVGFIFRGVEPPEGGITYPLPLNVAESGGTLDPLFTVDVPIIPGPPGPSTSMLGAPDVYGPFQEGQGVAFSAMAGGVGKPGFRPADNSPWAAKMFSVPEYSFGPASTYGSTHNVIATLIIPGQDQAYYPSIGGQVRWKRSGLFNNAQVEVQVRCLPHGSTDAPETGALCARALYDPGTLDFETVAHIHEHWSDESDPSRAVAPDSAVGRVPAGQSMVYYVLLTRVGGNGSIVYRTAGSHLDVKLFPVS
ncbi:minor tail protein [Mycobacterium phage Weirdo19]|uniref:Minor tail protein n=1 Tax=Mycobacterium phage Weirdo19 TaxID=2601610 RepID=A0A6M2YSN4_9CAUD|nr:minor tail protein [Mycobacterium phage Weirdo19]QEA10788.1 minor tail protein [Mycobacterium phage Weirdo19]